MTPEQQRIAIAKACGWTEVTFSGHSYQGIRPPSTKRYCNWNRPAPSLDMDDAREWHWIPDYINDLNAMNEAEKLDVLNPVSYREHLSTVYGIATARWDFERATASQRAEAFLRAIGKWEGEP